MSGAERPADRHREHPLTVRLPADVRAWVRQQAAARGVSERVWVRELVEREREGGTAD